MTQKIEVKCRLCDTREVFESAEAVNDSKWSGTAPLGIKKQDGSAVHNSYCPEHALEE